MDVFHGGRLGSSEGDGSFQQVAGAEPMGYPFHSETLNS